jgi:hypothetical protein
LRKIVSQSEFLSWDVIGGTLGVSAEEAHTRFLQLNRMNEHQIKFVPWTKKEDAILTREVKEMNGRKWNQLCLMLPGRTGKQCRERWNYQLTPSINKESWTEDELEQMVKLYFKFGTSWRKFTEYLPGRNTLQIKNKYNSFVKR